jgi:hypothetical protein
VITEEKLAKINVRPENFLQNYSDTLHRELRFKGAGFKFAIYE